MRRARELDPLEPLSDALSAQVAFQARDIAAALEHARRAVLLDSELLDRLHGARPGVRADGGRHDLALEALDGRGAVLRRQQQDDLAQGLRAREDRDARTRRGKC